ncbi:hypothetical protein A3D77_03030 [Candidatus Gottesmanbacteria bacterium RIFCSPHIGHO2_02_FULL_39_11]|uniref:CYTH domain-containing protein n=1 Tax=Candidatus Gottesmanbacteria bacterium RIFCSPHIGHO2_02_FULL_39_11 TaxID=1798382 RepID=A0A1F5ZLU5_9BACT|nr:MAG: hypothetical protein A3D77_03030 [Candidatus Gottesmanbacteria bacterium RIFCSPHIGHO2_02_FULL_39_11]
MGTSFYCEVESKHDFKREHLEQLIGLIPQTFIILENEEKQPKISTKFYFELETGQGRVTDEMKIKTNGTTPVLTHKTFIRKLGPVIIRREQKAKASNSRTARTQFDPILGGYQNKGKVQNNRYSFTMREENTGRVFCISLDDDYLIDPSDESILTSLPFAQMEVEYEGKLNENGIIENELHSGDDPFIDSDIIPSIKNIYLS